MDLHKPAVYNIQLGNASLAWGTSGFPSTCGDSGCQPTSFLLLRTDFLGRLRAEQSPITDDTLKVKRCHSTKMSSGIDFPNFVLHISTRRFPGVFISTSEISTFLWPLSCLQRCAPAKLPVLRLTQKNQSTKKRTRSQQTILFRRHSVSINLSKQIRPNTFLK